MSYHLKSRSPHSKMAQDPLSSMFIVKISHKNACSYTHIDNDEKQKRNRIATLMKLKYQNEVLGLLAIDMESTINTSPMNIDIVN